MDNDLKIDDALLEELGFVGLSTLQKQELQSQMLETLQMRIGLRLSEDLDDEQLKILESHFVLNEEDTPEQVAQKQQAVTDWLQQNHPNYKDVVTAEFEKLKAEMKNHSGDASNSVLS
jgi:hypothetical protein